MPHSRRTPSSTAMHADIQTPSWRTFIPSAIPPAHEANISSDDTSDEHYQSLHQPPLVEERARWAPHPQPNAPANKSTKNRGRPAPIFPTPAESVAIMRRALRRVKRPRKQNRDTQVLFACREALSGFDRTLAAFTNIENSLSSQSGMLSKFTREPRAATSSCPAATLRLPFPSLPDSESKCGRPSGAFAVANGAEAEQEVDAHIAVSSVVDGAIADLHDLELIMREKSVAFADRVAALAAQAQIPLNTPITCKSLRADIERVKKQEGENRSAGSMSDDPRGAYTLSECIRKEIDPKLYPTLAQTFRLHPEYYLDGTRRPVDQLLVGLRVDEEEDDMREVSPAKLPMGDAANGYNTDSHGLDADTMNSPSEDRDPDYVDPGLSMRDSTDDAMDVQPDLQPLPIRPSGRTPKHTKANGSAPRGTTPRRRGRPRKRKSPVHHGTSNDKREKKSFRVVEKDGELISSDPSDPSDAPTPPFINRRYGTPRRLPSPMHYQQVVDCDKEESDSLDIPMVVVELDNDDESGEASL